MQRNSRGFTIVELIITIVVIGVLATIGTFSFIEIQKQTRDSQREANVTSITEALEKYFEENGEYPGCEAMTADADIVHSYTLKSIDTGALRSPNEASNVTNSILCQDIANSTDGQDKVYYTGDTSAACQSGPACANWTLSWRNEAGEIKSVSSRRTAEAIAVTPALTVTASGFSQINVSWTAAQQAVSYELQRSSTAGFSVITNVPNSNRKATITGLAPSTTNYFRVRAVLPSSTSLWSEVKSATTGAIAAPTGTTTITAAMSGADARGTASGATCASGTTVERSIRYQENGGAWQSYTVGTTRDVTGTQGARYTFQAQARCVSGSYAGAYGATSGTASIIVPVSAPTGTITSPASLSGANAVATASGGTCAAGTSIERQMRSAQSNSAASGTMSAYATASSLSIPALQGYKYSFQQQARCVGANASSSWVVGAISPVVRPISTTPAAPTVTQSTSGDTTTFSWSAASCPTGTTAQYQYMSAADWDYTSPWYGAYADYTSNTWNTANQGYQYTRSVQARCYTANSTGNWSATGSANYLRPIATPPAAPSGYSTSISTDRLYVRTSFTTTCGPGTVSEWQYMANWTGTATFGGSWAATGYVGYGTVATQVMTDGGGNYVPFTSGTKTRIQARHRCVNTTTNRMSAWSAVTLSTPYTVP